MWHFQMRTGGTATELNISYSSSWSTGTWYHLAYCRSGNTLRFFKDGTQLGGDQSFTGTIGNYTGSFYIAKDSQTADRYFNGYMDDLRISNNARYTSNFTAPTAELVATSKAVTISSGTFPTNALNSRITLDGGSTWRDVTVRDSNTKLTLASYPSNGAYNWAMRMDEFAGGKVKLNDVGGTNLIGETVSIAPAFAQLTNCSQWSAIDDMTSTETANSQIIRHFIIHGPSGMTAYNDTDTVVSTFIPGAGGDKIYPYTTEANYIQQ